MSRATLADRTGINRGTLDRRLASQHPFTYEEMVSIASVFEVPLSELIERAEQVA